MVNQQTVDDQLKKIGVNFSFWGRNEIKELSFILSPKETIKHCVNGHYQGGFAMLAATDQRLMLVDRKPMFLTIEVIWYEKIGQIDFNHRLLNASVCISTPNKELNFTSWNNSKLREILIYTQERMTEAKEGTDGFRSGLAKAKENDTKYQVSEEKKYAITEQARSIGEKIFKPQLKQSSTIPQTYKFITQKLSNPYESTLYGATRLPFSRRRYYNRRVV